MAGGSGALTTAKKVNGACGGNALRRPGNIPGKHILGCGILNPGDLDGLSVIGSHYRCQIDIVMDSVDCRATAVKELHLVHNEPGIFRSLTLRTTGYSHLEFPQEASALSIRQEGSFLLKYGIHGAVSEFVPTPCGLSIYGNLVLVSKGTWGVKLGWCGGIGNHVFPSLATKGYFPAVNTFGGLGNLIGPAVFVPN